MIVRIKLTHQLRLPFSYDYLNADTILLVEDIRGAYYICRTDDDSVVCVHKNDCVEVKDNG